jgi:hypothetical protein
MGRLKSMPNIYFAMEVASTFKFNYRSFITIKFNLDFFCQSSDKRIQLDYGSMKREY